MIYMAWKQDLWMMLHFYMLSNSICVSVGFQWSPPYNDIWIKYFNFVCNHKLTVDFIFDAADTKSYFGH